jgi:hypothetical protein
MAKRSTAAATEAATSADAYRRLALALPGALESSHMGSPDFRVNGTIFATLAYQAKGLGTLKLTPDQQAEFLAEAPDYYTPAPGGWGRMGMTLVRLDAPESVLAGALSTAFHQVLSKQSAKKKPAPKRKK